MLVFNNCFFETLVKKNIRLETARWFEEIGKGTLDEHMMGICTELASCVFVCQALD